MSTNMIWYSLIFLATLAYTDAYRVVCYYTNWSQYRHGKGKFVPEDVDANLCTHLIYAFAKPVGLDIQPFEWNDDSTAWSKGMYERAMALKQKNPNLKILLALGGYNMGSQPFLPIVDTHSTRSTFAQAAIAYLRQRNFDGLDMDWEYPGTRGSTPMDKAKLVLLMQELMTAFQAEAASTGQPRLLLTGALPAGKPTIDVGYDVPNLAATMDFINLMTYDYHGSWETFTGMNSPLYAHTNDVGAAAQLNLDWTARYYVSLGAPRDKLNIGIATYGRSFTLDQPSQHNIGAPAQRPGNAGQFTSEKGFISYYEICDMLQSGAQYYDVPSQRNRYLVNGDQWIGYDDVQSVKEKACYTKQNGFGGVMFWALDLDDFSGTTCGQGTYPLISAVIQEMNSPSTANCIRSSGGGGTGPVVGTTSPPYVPPITQTPPPFQPATATPAMSQTSTFDCSNRLNDFYADPYTCEYFYICADKVTYKVHCATGLLFNENLKHCDFAANVNCNKQSNAGQGTNAPITAAPATSAPVNNNNNNINSGYNVCGRAQSGLMAHPYNCHKFIQCVSGTAYEMDCQTGMVFNAAIGACDFAASTTCNTP